MIFSLKAEKNILFDISDINPFNHCWVILIVKNCRPLPLTGRHCPLPFLKVLCSVQQPGFSSQAHKTWDFCYSCDQPSVLPPIHWCLLSECVVLSQPLPNLHHQGVNTYILIWTYVKYHWHFARFIVLTHLGSRMGKKSWQQEQERHVWVSVCLHGIALH